MATSYSLTVYVLIHCVSISILAVCTNFFSHIRFAAASYNDSAVAGYDWSLFHGDYTPPAPPPPSLPPLPPPLSCKDGLNGTGSLNTSCKLDYDLNFTDNVYIFGEGDLIVHPGVKVSCPRLGCEFIVNIRGEFKLGIGAVIVAGSVHVVAENATFMNGSMINVTALAGSPPEHTSGRPNGAQGAGGGYGGRGASCVMDNEKLPSDVWGGDPYGWESMTIPFHQFHIHQIPCLLHILSIIASKMTIIIDQPSLGEEKKITSHTNEVILDECVFVPENESNGGFDAPEVNAFGNSFRDYNVENERQKSVEEFYRINHINQSYDFVKRMREEYGKLNKVEMSIWECCELLNDVVDDSDPDLDEPQIQHLLQTAEAIRKDYPDEDWLHLTALIHDLGKVLCLPKFGGLPQWAVVGDTFPLGCGFDESIVHYKYMKDNPDYNNPLYKTKNGVYSEGCGLENVMISWGHDDYMYLVAKENGTTLPSAGLFVIRFHSFYPLHRSGAYKHLMNDEDIENLKWLQIFNKYDLYSKSKVQVDVEKVKPYYMSLIEKYFPAKLRW